MKSAYELAMARLGGGVRTYTAAQKQELADIDKVYDAKAAQVKLGIEARLKAADTPEKDEAIRREIAAELTATEAQREKKKEELRSKFQKP